MHASKLHKPLALLRLKPYHACIKPAQTSPTPGSIKPAQTSLTPAPESLSCVHQTCTNLTHSCVWILLIRAPNLHKPNPLLCLNPSHTCTKSTQTSPTPASESISCMHQTCTNLTHSCAWIPIMRASNLQKPNPFLCLNPFHTCTKSAQTSPTPASESISCMHQTCKILTQSCAWIPIMRASNLHKPDPFLCLNPSHTCTKSAQTSPTPGSIKHAQTSLTPAPESLSCVHQTCTNLTHSCVWILLIRAPNLHKHRPLLRRNPSHACIKPAQTSLTPAPESLSCMHQTCTNLTHSCVWILLIRAPNLHKHRPLLRRNSSHAWIKPAKSSLNPAPESLSCVHQTCTNLTHSWVWILLIRAPNLHKHRPLLGASNLTQSCVWVLIMHASNLHKPSALLGLKPYHACIKPAQTSPTPATESFLYKHQIRTNLTHSCAWIPIMRASNLHKTNPFLCLNLSHTCTTYAQTSPTPASESI